MIATYIDHSFFDIYESYSPNPIQLSWKLCSERKTIPKEEIIYKGELITISEILKEYKKKYVLTMNSLIEYDTEESDTLFNILGRLSLRNPRIRKADKNSSNLHGFVLDGYKNSIAFYCDTKKRREEWLKNLQKMCIQYNIMDVYSFENLIGKGSFAKVHLCTNKKNNEKFAIKTIKKETMIRQGRNMDCLIKEIEIMRIADHSNIIKLYEVYESDMYIHLVMEYIDGGDLLDKIKNKGVYSEKDACFVIFCILGILDYCHAKNIIHRDLKPENLIIMYF